MSEKNILQKISDLGKSVPAEAWDNVPTDLSTLDHGKAISEVVRLRQHLSEARGKIATLREACKFKNDKIEEMDAIIEPFAEWARLTKLTHPTMIPEDHILEAKLENGPAVYVVHWEAFLNAWRAYRSKGVPDA